MRFVVFSHPRNGTTWFCEMLNSHPELKCYWEVFNINRDVNIKEKHTLLQLPVGISFLEFKKYWNENTGFKIFGTHEYVNNVIKYVKENDDIIPIFLYRENIFDSLISQFISMDSGNFVQLKNEKLNWNPIKINNQLFNTYIDIRFNYERKIFSNIKSNRILVIKYEDLLKDKNLINRLYAELNVKSDYIPKYNCEKISINKKDVVENYLEIKKITKPKIEIYENRRNTFFSESKRI